MKWNLKETLKEIWKEKVENPIANKTQELENSAIQQVSSAWNNYSPSNYYWKHEPFYRGLILMGVGLVVLPNLAIKRLSASFLEICWDSSWFQKLALGLWAFIYYTFKGLFFSAIVLKNDIEVLLYHVIYQAKKIIKNFLKSKQIW